uniref:Uncharacterized protein n=1 Tax=Anopheles albimanus TaxID=7167 RepID=A0A182FWK5_ANOAL
MSCYPYCCDYFSGGCAPAAPCYSSGRPYCCYGGCPSPCYENCPCRPPCASYSHPPCFSATALCRRARRTRYMILKNALMYD